MAAPWYRDFQSADIPEYTTPDGITVRVIAGESQSRQGAVTRPVTEPLYLDIHLPAGSRFEQPLPAEHNAFVVVYRGTASIGGSKLRERQMAILANSPDADRVIIEADTDAKAILVAGRPLNEPIVQHGPFVMNTHEEIVAAVRDFQQGRFGG
jgi:redox-sensitive bicupin YhaK (pirin superfamily)